MLVLGIIRAGTEKARDEMTDAGNVGVCAPPLQADTIRLERSSARAD